MRLIPSLAPESTVASPDRRAFPRVDVRYPIRLEASLRTPTTRILRLDVRAVTVDLSRGGLLASLPESLAPGVRCEVHFLLGEDHLRPGRVLARVRRLMATREAALIAVEFDEALEYLQADGLDSHRPRRGPLQLLSHVFSS